MTDDQIDIAELKGKVDALRLVVHVLIFVVVGLIVAVCKLYFN